MIALLFSLAYAAAAVVLSVAVDEDGRAALHRYVRHGRHQHHTETMVEAIRRRSTS